MLWLQDLDSDQSGSLSFDEFCVLDQSYPTVLYPAFRIQQKFKALLLSPKEWDKMAVQREIVTGYQVGSNMGMAHAALCCSCMCRRISP